MFKCRVTVGQEFVASAMKIVLILYNVSVE